MDVIKLADKVVYYLRDFTLSSAFAAERTSEDQLKPLNTKAFEGAETLKYLKFQRRSFWLKPFQQMKGNL